ncbi:MAG: PKD domain-containing protein [Flavobacteriales bacterium]|nr:PKD domain-containing protein [Flavobacteriales bacterium]
MHRFPYPIQRSLSTLLASCFLGTIALAQQRAPSAHEACGFDAAHRRKLVSDRSYQENAQRFEERLASFDLSQRDAGTLFVPVVVHVLETGTDIGTISDAQVQDAIKVLNQRYRKVPGSLGAGSGVDTQIEFALAVRDPQGNCTNGITRHNMTGNTAYMNDGVQYFGANGITESQVRAVSVWDQTKYYNMWLVSEFDGNGGGAGLQGFAYFSGSHGTSVDGTIILVNAFKNPSSTTLAHELGHAFNVYHTFEGDADGTTCPSSGPCASTGDLVCDTPPHIRSASNCNIGGTNSCDGGSSNSLFVQNYMDYSSDACQNMFTAGQNVRIQAALTIDRASFLASNGNLSLVPPAAPSMDMGVSSSLLCGAGQSVQFFDRSSCVPNTFLADPDLPGLTFAWTVTNGVNTYTSDQQNPVITLGSAGVYNATLSITTGLGTFTRSEQGMVVVVPAPVAACTPTSSNTGNFGQTVNSVTFNTISNSTSSVNNVAYTDFSCTQNTTLAVGATYTLAVGIRAGGSAAESLNGYIDYNNNGTFEDPSERIITGSTPTSTSTTLTANVTIPGTAVTNTLLRMRLYGEAGTLSATERTCGAAFFIGDVEDYGVYITNSIAAVSIVASPSNTITYGTNVTFTPTPVNGGGSPSYVWLRNGANVGTGNTYSSNNLLPGETIRCEMTSNLAGVIASPALSNTISMVVTGPPLSDFSAAATAFCAGGSTVFSDKSLLAPTSWSWTFPGGTPGTSTAQNPTVTYSTPGTYAVTLVASNANGTGTTMTKTGYITVYAAPNSGCTVTRSTTPAAGIGITNVTLNTINNTTAYDGAVMNNYVCSQITTLQPNTTYTISVTVGAANSQWVRAYIDYNGDGDFVDLNEQIFAPANGTGVRSGTFTVLAAPPSTNTLLRMRVITDFLNTAPGPCTTPVQYGQVEEYGIVISAPAGIAVAAKAFLEGPYDATTGLMADGLRSASLIPSTEPYTALGYSFVGGGGETVAPAVLAVTGSNAIVDWVVVELRDNTNPTTVLASKAALLQRDGDVVATNGTSALSFGLPAATYRVAIRHRNHLPAMTLNGVALSSVATTVDLTATGTATFGTEARRSVTGAFPTQALWTGDVNFDGDVKYTGDGNDRDIILVDIGGAVPTNETNGYNDSDVNMDGITRYTGGDNDRDRILQAIGGFVPTTIREAQLP